jgi:hypothetical protein
MSISKPLRWQSVWLTAIVVAGTVVFAFEQHWRARGYEPSVMDSRELWAQQRDRVVSSSPQQQVALLGASRIQYGISIAAFEDEAKRLSNSIRASMLAVNGHYPLAGLRDLAQDNRFRGVAVVGIDSRGFQKRHREMQQPWVHYYGHEWTPARNLHRTLLTMLQRHSIATRSDFSWSNLLTRWLDGFGPPHRDYVTFHADRSGATDYARSDVELIKAWRIRELASYYADTPPISSDAWLTDNEQVIEWVRAISARGGEVVFYREPASGEHLDLDEARFPRKDFWDALAKKMPATMIDFRDYSELNIPTPDTSHIDARDIDRHTRAFVRVLASKGVFAKR